jgi:hypothetical protein
LIPISVHEARWLPAAQQPVEAPSARTSWTGGQGTSPNEQNTQQSPGFGFIRMPQLPQS